MATYPNAIDTGSVVSINPYAAPESDVEQNSTGHVENGSIFWGRGRLSVVSFIAHYVLLVIIQAALTMLVILATRGLPAIANAGLEFFQGIPAISWLPNAILPIFFGWIGTCLVIKRLHDRNISGWWLLLFITIPFMIAGFMAYFRMSEAALVPAICMLALGVICLLPGKIEANRFGARRATLGWEKVFLITVAVLFVVIGVSSQFINLPSL